MTIDAVRVTSEWLKLREPADAAARAGGLVEMVRAELPSDGEMLIHDLGCGSGSMARWLSARLPGPQHWVMHDWDDELLTIAATEPPERASDGGRVTSELRRRDITRLGPGELSGARLITASALLDMMTAAEIERLVVACARVGCPVLISLSVTGRVGMTPPDPFDRWVTDAFNAHQRRATVAGRLLGPAALDVAVDSFARLGFEVLVHPSPWQLGPGQAALVTHWFTGWLSAACEQRPELLAEAAAYSRRRMAEAAGGRLSVTVHHLDLLARRR